MLSVADRGVKIEHGGDPRGGGYSLLEVLKKAQEELPRKRSQEPPKPPGQPFRASTVAASRVKAGEEYVAPAAASEVGEES